MGRVSKLRLATIRFLVTWPMILTPLAAVEKEIVAA